MKKSEFLAKIQFLSWIACFIEPLNEIFFRKKNLNEIKNQFIQTRLHIFTYWKSLKSRAMLDLLFFNIQFVSRDVSKSKSNQLEWRVQNPVYSQSETEKLKFCAPFNDKTLISQNPVGQIKEGEKLIKDKPKVSTMDIQITRSV